MTEGLLLLALTVIVAITGFGQRKGKISPLTVFYTAEKNTCYCL